MKEYPKTNENVSRAPFYKQKAAIGSAFGTIDDLTALFRTFLRDAHRQLFDICIKQVWLEQKFTYNGVRRTGRSHNGFGPDWTYSYYMCSVVGISQKATTNGFVFTAIPTYFKDFFPNFYDHNPFEEPEYFRYPYEHVTLDFLIFIYQYHDRLALLDEAERRKMTYTDFVNWAANHVISETLENEGSKGKYVLCRYSFTPYIKLLKDE